MRPITPCSISASLCTHSIMMLSKNEPGLVDEYPLKPKDPTVTITTDDVKRLLGIDLTAKQIAELLTRLEFKCTVNKDSVKVQTPGHRLDIGEGIVGLADVLE